MKVTKLSLVGVFTLLISMDTISAPIDIPLKTWVARPLVSTQAPCLSGCKHMRMTHNPVNGLIYVLGGDHSGSQTGFPQSGRNEMYTYSIALDEWKLEQQYCRTDGTPQPSGPDEVGWVYDTKRNVFWQNPGYNWDQIANCPNSNLVRDHIMSYDPTNKVWTDENRTNIKTGAGITAGNARFAQYDPVEDTFVVMVEEGAYIYDIKNDKWTKVPLTGMSQYGLNGDDYTALDLENRLIYYVENRWTQHLFAYDMDGKTLIDLGPLPANTPHKESHGHWDSVNKVILWPYWNDDEGAEILKLYVYHPNEKVWEEIPIVPPQGYTVRGRISVFDPYQNVLMVMGPKNQNSPVFLYRYGDGSGGTPVDSIAPSAPSALGAAQ